MPVLQGRERLLYARRPGWSMVAAGYFAVVGVALLVLGLARAPAVAPVALVPLAFSGWMFYRARWTRGHPEVRQRVMQRSDERLTAHPRRYMVFSVVVLGGLAAMELWRFTVGHHHAPPPAWAWPAVVAAGMLLGYLSWRVPVARASQRRAGERPYPIESRFRDAADATRATSSRS